MITALIGWMIFGLVVGAIARFLVPGPQAFGLLKTMLIGVAGSFLGGFAGFLLAGGSPLQASGWIGSVIGAVALVLLSTRRSRVTA